MIGVDFARPAGNVAERLLDIVTLSGLHTGHVFTLHAELEGMKLAPVFEKLMAGGAPQGYRTDFAARLLESLATRTAAP